MIKNLIAKHQRIVNLFENIEDIFTIISFLQFFFNITAMCFVGFILVTSLGSDQASTVISKCLPYYIALNFEALILCYTGEYLSSKSENIGWVAYNSNWYELTMYENRTLLLLILRSQKPLTLTIGKFMNLSLETFANMLKASASYISVLHAME
ncbi:odorant receptor 85b-like [Xylocopa sonorina]|uniref:odorant receptor 85b-like n=1 Tax=Xylocopa sonorina TaxID=1818115 RepID=UPI00403AD2D1